MQQIIDNDNQKRRLKESGPFVGYLKNSVNKMVVWFIYTIVGDCIFLNNFSLRKYIY